jgi:hypothetical protein
MSNENGDLAARVARLEGWVEVVMRTLPLRQVEPPHGHRAALWPHPPDGQRVSTSRREVLRETCHRLAAVSLMARWRLRPSRQPLTAFYALTRSVRPRRWGAMEGGRVSDGCRSISL